MSKPRHRAHRIHERGSSVVIYNSPFPSLDAESAALPDLVAEPLPAHLTGPR